MRENTETSNLWKIKAEEVIWYNLITSNFIVHIKLDDVYADLTGKFETRTDTSNYEVKRPLPKFPFIHSESDEWSWNFSTVSSSRRSRP